MSEDLISKEKAYEVLTEYYHHKTEMQHKALREALDRVPSANLQPTCNKLATSCNQLATDCISRQAVFDAIDEIESEVADGDGFQYEKWRQYFCELPSADIDLSDYSDRLWRKAYERGKADAASEIIRCKDCKHNQGSCCDYSAVYIRPNGYCQWAERKDDEVD